MALEKALPLRIEMVRILTEVQNYLIASITTNGGLGNVTNWQQHILPRLMREPGMLLEKFLGRDLPENAKLPNQYSGLTHMFLPTLRATLNKGESLNLKIRTISTDNSKPTESVIYWRTLGEGRYKSEKLNHLANGVYEFRLAPEEINDKGLEYYVQVKFENGNIKRFPATAPDINQTVILLPE